MHPCSIKSYFPKRRINFDRFYEIFQRIKEIEGNDNVSIEEQQELQILNKIAGELKKRVLLKPRKKLDTTGRAWVYR